MSASSEQICILFKQGNTPEQISELLGHELINVLLILNSAGYLTKKKIEKNVKASCAISGNNNLPKEGGAVDGKDSVTINMDADPTSNNLVEELDFKDPIEVYKKYQIQIARKLCATALSDPDDDLPAGVIAKVQIYCNEEATGRNESRAKRNDNPVLLNIAQLLMQAQLADAKVNKALGIKSTEVIIETQAEKVA